MVQVSGDNFVYRNMLYTARLPEKDSTKAEKEYTNIEQANTYSLKRFV